MSLSGINFIFHTIARAGGMERAVVDMICGFASRGIPVRGIALRTDISVFPEPLRKHIELIRVPARFPFCISQRFANLDFENRALNFIRPEWKTISASRVPGSVDMAISGGTHLAHLYKKGKRRPSFTDKLIIQHEKQLYSQAKICVAHSQETQKEILELNVAPKERVTCLFPPVETHKFNLNARSRRTELRASWNVSDEDFVLLFPSNNHELKGAELILDALEELNDKSLFLAVASRRDINHPKVINLGFHPDIEYYYAAADATILASKYEAFGLVAVESILCGTPALLSEFCGAKDALLPPACTVFPRTKDGICKAILEAKKSRLSQKQNFVPADSIAYPYSLEKHIDALCELLAR